MYSALDVAKYAIDKCIADDHPINNMQLQKILYFVQRDFLTKKECPAFYEDIEAWQWGPVVPDVFYRFCGAGANPLTIRLRNGRKIAYGRDIIDNVILENRDLMPWDLMRKIIEAKSAWYQVYHGSDNGNIIIPNQMIRDFG